MGLKFPRSLLLLASALCVAQREAMGAVGKVASDDSGCSADTFRCQTELSGGTHCITLNWVCDGDEDCPDGDDEANCENPTCPPDQFLCVSGMARCISLGWLCDGENDCDDGADEKPDLCQTHKKKGVHDRGLPFLPPEIHYTITNALPEGDQVHQFQCLPNQYRCPGTQTCISYRQLCDDTVDCPDGTDEGGHCRNGACSRKHCMEECKETTQGPQCFCRREYQKPNGSVCQDLNECQYEIYCDQSCKDSTNGYSCECQQGYILQNKSKCVVDPKLHEPRLFIANQTAIKQLERDGSELQQPYFHPPQGDRILAFDFDVANNSICWVPSKSPMMCADIDNSRKMWTVTVMFSLEYVKQLAKDWVSGNWYFADEVKEQIFLCTADGIYCMSVIHTGINRPKCLALDPTKGYMFYADWSTSSKIGRADLDGTNQKDLVTKKIVHPNGITLDFALQHLYWGDSFLDYIERVDYDGNGRRVILPGIKVHQVFSVALLENDLYFINHQDSYSSIVLLHRYDNSRHKPEINMTMVGLVAIKVFHQVRQPLSVEMICQKKNCSHLCIPVPGNGSSVAKCVCKAGYSLTQETRCNRIKVGTYLLYTNAQQGTVRSVAMDPLISEDVQEPIHNLIRPVALAVDPRNNDVYFSDVKTLQISRHNAESTDPPTVLLGKEVGATSCEGLAVDWIGNNLYWTDDDHRSIFAASLHNLSLVARLVSSNLTHPKSIVLDPQNGMMYWTDWVMRPATHMAKIECAQMNGAERRTLAKDVQWPNSLFLDTKENRLYWTEAYYDRIQSMHLDGSDLKVLVPQKYLDHPYGVVVHEGTVYWTESLKGQVRSFRNDMIILRNDSKPLFSLVAVGSQEVNSTSNHPCVQDNRCSDLCIPTGLTSYVCMCALGRALKLDNVTCSGNLEPLTCDSTYQFQCQDGSCIPISMKCNGISQCHDKSDEDLSMCGNTTCGSQMFRCDINKCLYQQFVCDGEYDCHDHSDEQDTTCKDRKCPGNHTRCASNNHCIPEAWKCDGEKDCQDGSDENPEECQFKSRTCSVHDFRCLNGRCIPHTYRCDYEYDCDDHTDEADCHHWCDPVREFKCKDGSTCLPISYLCDGERNCPDGTDELKCLNQRNSCQTNEFVCIEDSSCIPKLARCDGIGDCKNSSDEVGCDSTKMQYPNATNTCHWSEFKCEDGSRCVPSAWKCDGDNDCADRSDERYCSFVTSCKLPNFLCTNHSNMCLPPEKVCNDVFDCPDHSDEGRLCGYDNCLNNDCSDECYTFPDGYACGCFKGRTLQDDNKTCTDIDICDHWGVCSQNCTRVPSGKKCECYPGYSILYDGYSCKADGEVHLIFSRRHEIRQQNVRNLEEQSLVTGLRNTIAIDFLWEKKWLFWTDVGDDKIYRGTILEKTVTDIHRIVDVGLSTTEGIAVDWVAGNIYWVESNLDQIEVAKWDGSNRTTLLAGSMQSPRAIALDPRDGLLFWTDWDGEMPRIERAAMSGQRETRTTIFDIRKVSGSGWPNGLALDYDSRRLYWVDARSDSVHCTNYAGSDHQLIITSHEYLSHPFALTVFEHYVYWTDWRMNGVVRANKFNGSGIEVMQKTYTQPFDIKVFHPNRQPKVDRNPCENNGGCSNLCLLGQNGTSVCACPHRFRLTADNKTCEKDDTFLLYVKENEIRGVDLSYAHYNVIPSITVPFVENASAIDYDVQADRLYWTDRKRNVINSAFLNGTGVQTVIDTGLSNPEGFAIDWVSHNMYFTSYDEKEASISVANLDGAYRKVILSRENSKPNSMVIHPRKGVMFWSDLGGAFHCIMRANMDGTNATIFATNLNHPASLTLDMEEEKLYWVNRKEGKVLYCPLSQPCTKPADWNSSQNLTSSLYSMAIYDKTAIFASNNSITKIDLETRDKMSWKTDTQLISAMQVYNPKIRGADRNGCSEKNGGCQQLCLPLPGLVTHICQCTSGFDLSVDGKTCLGVQPFILYSTESKIRGMTLNGDVKKEVLAPVSRTSLAASVDFYAKKDIIYWADTNLQTISRIKRDLSQRENVVTDGVSRVESVAVDWVAENIYWVDRGHQVIQVARLDGSHRYVVIHDNMDKPRSIAVDPKNGYLYYTETGTFPRIVRARLDGSQRENFVVSQPNGKQEEELPVLSPEGLAVDFAENMLYWCDKRRDVIEKVNLTSGAREVIVSTGLMDCRALAVYSDRIYWADQSDHKGSIKSARKMDGSNIKLIAENIDKLQDIKIFNTEFLDITNPCSVNNGGCEELCLYIGGSSVKCACSHGKVAKDNKTCEDYDSFLLYSKVTSIESLHLSNKTDLNSPQQPLHNEQNMHNVIGLAYDFASQRVFFSDIQSGEIASVFFNNTGYTQVVRNVGSIEGLAFDSLHHTLYWTSYTNSSINFLNFQPQDTAPSVPQPKILVQLSASDHPRAIVVNPCIKRVFWTNWNDRQPAIQTVQFNGHNAMSIISEDIRTPNGLAIDYGAQKLYWSDARLDKIERCDYDGSNRVVIVTSVPQHSFGLTVHGDFLYWTDWVLRAVLRANKYDGSGLTWLSKNLQRQPMGIIAVDKQVTCENDPCHLNAFGCDEICSVLADGTPLCRCFDGHALLSDNKRCVAEKLKDLCQDDTFVCHSKQLCIPINATCNGIIDCLEDASDEAEEFCMNRECPASYFRCTDAQGLHRCIERHHVCDGAIDCADASDEEFCPCHDDEFRCSNGMCIKAKYRCDHDSDCPDHSDEIGCNFNCSNLQTVGAKLEELVSCNTTSMCIYPSWICDRSNDCWDNNDEKNCNYTNRECPDNISCNDGTCILPQWRCDKDYDCADRSDEANCTYKCEKDQVACNDSTCVPSTWICDSLQDCSDHSDEQNCDHRKCNNETEFQCSSGRCIPLEWKCDGDTDCNDGADERVDIAGCMPVKCDTDQFQCLNRQCIRNIFYCDGDNDCGDFSDEPKSCVYENCTADEFKCATGHKCIPAEQRCNKQFECPDHSDEVNCTETEPVPCGNSSFFQCGDGKCIPQELVCNNVRNCSDGSDEPSICNVNECKFSNGGCLQRCINKTLGFECQCYPGYELQSNKRDCRDIDECTTLYPCSHFCENQPGSFICSCADGYALDRNKTSCKSVKNPKPRLLLANRYYIRLVNMTTGSSTVLFSNLTNAVAVDYDWKDQYVYWTDITSFNSSINRMPFNNTFHKVEPQVLHSTTVRNPDGLAVDWVGRNLYWCDKTTDTIEVSRLDGQYRLVLLREDLEEPRGLEVYPQRGLLFYSDWGDTPHIGRLNMNGTNHMRIIEGNLAWPNALTIDYVTGTIFWADGNLDYIGMADADGRNRRVVISENLVVPHVFAITTFENRLYWTDWGRHAVTYADKFSGHNVKNLTTLVHRPMDIQVVHPLRQVPVLDSDGLDPCERLQCSHLCLLHPVVVDGNAGVAGGCACPENHYLAGDGRQCISNCTSSQTLCSSSSKCIPFWWQCDGHSDCEDGSDEPETCGKYYCQQRGMYQCQNASSSEDCLPPYQICDGQKQCQSGSDEVLCKTYQCMQHYIKCKADDKCIPETQRCDNHNHCSDGEDEKNCMDKTCSSNQFACNNTRCVPFVWRCDNDNDCGDGSDEPEDCQSLKCQDAHFKCAVTGRCIPQAWMCDGDNDCGDQDFSDEMSEQCHQKTCDPTYFKCNNGHCIPGRWHCDFYDDCKDGSDELDCQRQNCTDADFRCEDGRCIPLKLKCDRNVDCADHSDERNCDSNCTMSEFKCHKVEHCVPSAWRCDGDTDCADGSDEWNCNRTCPAGEFQCNNTICQPLLWRCDGDNDCGDQSDENEQLCASLSCGPGRFRCNNHICIWNSMVCDGNNDCDDGLDENNITCSEVNKCMPPRIQCPQSHLCLPRSKLCNNVTDCATSDADDRSDEDPAFCRMVVPYHNCSENQGGCDHICHHMEYGVFCSCKKGFELEDDGYTCTEINPCSKWGTCSQLCMFDNQTYKHNCSCEKGYQPSGVFCLAPKDNPPSLLLAMNATLHRDFLKSALESPTVEVELQQGQKIVSMDVDMTGSEWKVFYSIHEKENQWHIYQKTVPSYGANRNRRDTSSSKIYNSTSELRGLAVDWVSQRLYWVDTTQRAIRVAEYDGKRSKVVVNHTQLHSPSALVVDAGASKLYWTDRGLFAGISSANLDGSDRVALVEKDIYWPVDLALDSANSRLYWVDIKKYTLETVSVLGKDRHVVHKFHTSESPLALDVFENSVFILVASSSGNIVLELDKFHGSNHSKIYLREHTSDIVVAHPLKQKTVDSACSNSPCKETQVCFNLPVSRTSCLCPDGAIMDGKRCSFQKPCPPGYCLNSGTCFEKLGTSKCSCPPNFQGERCEINRRSCSQNPCLNGGTCLLRPFGFSCECPHGFHGDVCEHCVSHFCANGGTCVLDGWRQKCLCLPDFDPASNCELVTCEKFCRRGNSSVDVYRTGCNCGCPPSFTARDCNSNCIGYCLNSGSCNIDSTGKPLCKCDEYHSGEKCEKCKCEPGGECADNRTDIIMPCRCKPGYSGHFCESFLASSQGSPGTDGLTVGIPLAATVAVILLLIIIIMLRRRRRESQYNHKRMQEGGELNVTNPVYMRKDPDDDDDDEMEPLGARDIYTGSSAANFGNPIYDMYTTTSESTQKLLQETNNQSEERELLESGLPVRYFGTNEGPHSKTKKNPVA